MQKLPEWRNCNLIARRNSAVDPTVALIYEIVSFVSFLAVLVWAIRSRDPLNLGAIVGGFMMWTFDWLWCTRGFWNVTVEQNALIPMPGLEIQGVRYPLAAACNWAVAFGFIPLLLSYRYEPIRRALGILHLPVMLVAFGVFDVLVEALVVNVLRVYAYHQEAKYLFMGVAWSNVWLLGGYFTAAYVGLAHVRRWIALPKQAGISFGQEATWKGIYLGIAAIITPAFTLGMFQLWWWSAVSPWTESGRPF